MKKIHFSIKNIVVIGFLLGFALVLIRTPYTKAETSTSEALAPNSYTVLAPLPCIESPATDNNPGVTCEGGNGSLQTKLDFKTYVQYTINLLIGLSAVVAVVMMVWGGVEYIYSASFSDKKMGLEKVKNAVTGFVLILTSYIIMRTIDPRLVEIPNSLVPQITINKYLAQDANQLLMNQVQSDIDRSKIQIAEYYDKMQQAIKSVTDKQKEIDDIKKQIEDIKSNPAGLEAVGAEQKLRELQIKQAKSEEELAVLQIASTVASVKQRVNLILSAAQDNLQAGADIIIKDPKELIKQLNDSKAQVTTLENRAHLIFLTKINNVEEYKKITEQTDYGYAKLDLYKINLIINDAYNTTKSTGMGIGGSGSKQVISVMKSDGSDRIEFNSKDLAKKYMQDQINIVIETKNKILDEQLKTEIQKQIDYTQNQLNGITTFNKK